MRDPYRHLGNRRLRRHHPGPQLDHLTLGLLMPLNRQRRSSGTRRLAFEHPNYAAQDERRKDGVYVKREIHC